MKIDVVTSPEDPQIAHDRVTIFLGGSIEAGKARDWQNELIVFLQNSDNNQKLQIFNPRRAAWDASWPIDDPNHAELKNQIRWELRHQDQADILIYYFARETISPVTLFDLGIYANRQPLIFIEQSYQRLANVKITADHFDWTYYTNENDFRKALLSRIVQLSHSL